MAERQKRTATANKNTSRKSTSDGSRKTRKMPAVQEEKRRARVSTPHPEEESIPREVWAAIYGVLGVLCLISVLKNDGFVLRMIHTALGGLFGWVCTSGRSPFLACAACCLHAAAAQCVCAVRPSPACLSSSAHWRTPFSAVLITAQLA